jgi:hypothetical protein
LPLAYEGNTTKNETEKIGADYELNTITNLKMEHEVRKARVIDDRWYGLNKLYKGIETTRNSVKDVKERGNESISPRSNPPIRKVDQPCDTVEVEFFVPLKQIRPVDVHD